MQPTPGMSSAPERGPLFVTGRVLLDTGQPVPEAVSVELSCGLRTLQVIRTDLKGYFQFTLGAGPQGNVDLSAADDTPTALGLGPNVGSGIGGSSFPASGAYANLSGCDLRVTLDGFQSAVHPIASPPDLGTIDVGTLRLTRIAGVQGSAVSVTSMLVPSNARKEYEKGESDARSNKLKSATEHFQKAVAEYDNYAAAWSELGRMYAAADDQGSARQSFVKAIAVDPQYLPPYLNLANLQLQALEYQNAAETAGKALALNPGVYIADYQQALAYFRLGRLDDAEKSARAAEESPRQNIPQVHALLAEILLAKQDNSGAAAEMRAYLKQAPKGPLAPDIKKKLDQIETPAASAEGSPKVSSSSPNAAQ